MKQTFSAILPNGKTVKRSSESHQYSFVVVSLLNTEPGDCTVGYVLNRMAAGEGSWTVQGWRSKREDAEALSNDLINRRYVLKSRYLGHGRTRNSRCAVEVVDEYGPKVYGQVLILPVVTG